jgi:hypothetical protein
MGSNANKPADVSKLRRSLLYWMQPASSMLGAAVEDADRLCEAIPHEDDIRYRAIRERLVRARALVWECELMEEG